VGSPNGNVYTSAVNGISLPASSAQLRGSVVQRDLLRAGRRARWTVSDLHRTMPALSARRSVGPQNANTYQTTTTEAIGAGTNYFVWTVYNAPTGLPSVSYASMHCLRWSDTAASVSNNNEVHDELYTSYIVQTKSFNINATNCSGLAAAGTWCPGATLKYTIDVRNIAVAAKRHDAASATLTANTLLSDRRRLERETRGQRTAVYRTRRAPRRPEPRRRRLTYFYNATSSANIPGKLQHDQQGLQGHRELAHAHRRRGTHSSASARSSSSVAAEPQRSRSRPARRAVSRRRRRRKKSARAGEAGNDSA